MARLVRFAAAVLLLAVACGVSAQEDRPLRVCTTLDAGFNMMDDIPEGGIPTQGMLLEGDNVTRVTGFDADLRHVLFRNAGLRWNLRVLPNYFSVIYFTRIGLCEVGFAPFFVTRFRDDCNCPMPENIDEPTPENACCVDYSHMYFEAGLALMVRESDGQSTNEVLMDAFVHPSMVNAICALLLAIVLAGHLLWYLERHENAEQFPTAYVDGVDDGVWWAAVTITTTGFGDKFPVTPIGKCFTLFWMFIGVISSSIFTGFIASRLTAAYLVPGITGLNQLHGTSICTPTVYTPLLRDEPVTTVVRENVEDCVDLLTSGQVSGVLYDTPILQYTSVRVAGTLVTPNIIESDLAITFQEGLPQARDINVALLKLVEDSAIMAELQEPYFSEASGLSDAERADDPVDMVLVYSIIIFVVLYFSAKFYHGVWNPWRRHVKDHPKQLARSRRRASVVEMEKTELEATALPALASQLRNLAAELESIAEESAAEARGERRDVRPGDSVFTNDGFTGVVLSKKDDTVEIELPMLGHRTLSTADVHRVSRLGLAMDGHDVVEVI
eukprot:PLAT424.1.p1 GENE.PLAT424.1~~PLAT424.1.p1  ORF type:complete len:556 (+),score=191.36 PLAT424.1:22-1689(+)